MTTSSFPPAVPMTWPHATSDVDSATHTGGGVLHVNGDELATHPQQHLWIDDVTNVQSYADWAATHGYTFFAITPYSSVAAWKKAYPTFILTTTLPGISQDQSPISPFLPDAPSQQQAVIPFTPIRPQPVATSAPPAASATAPTPGVIAAPSTTAPSSAAPAASTAAVSTATAALPPQIPAPAPSPVPASDPAALLQHLIAAVSSPAAAPTPAPAPVPAAAHIPPPASVPAAAPMPPPVPPPVAVPIPPPAPVPAAASIPQASTSQDQTNALLLQLLQLMVADKTKATPATKEPKMPSWNGTDADVPRFLQAIELFKQDKYFEHVTDWTQTQSGEEEQSRYIMAQLLETVPEALIHPYLSSVKYKNDGIAVLRDYLEEINPTSPQNLLKTAIDWASLEMGPQESGSQFMQRVRTLSLRLENCSLPQFIYLLALAKLCAERYPGIAAKYQQGDPTLISGTVDTLTEAVKQEDILAKISDPHAHDRGIPSANRASTDGPQKQPPARQPPRERQPYHYPYKPMKWVDLGEVIKEGVLCPLCYQPWAPLHEACGGCPAAAKHGKVLNEDKEAVAEILKKYKAYQEKHPRSYRKKPSDANTDTPVSGKRATSSERPPPAPAPPPRESDVNPFAALR
eukprot:CAMPEP_0201695634 /NCGR_PEP_ID=MMETSP0578-20130828/7511_1 /ASSEMBLY_ACC=CAM_ASM_000663 /TAXON_ID=267565 /ORGANISM="Skeletonema grethea, Strain CCMP 1804" /LENGTH=630 /DNA_ID=CAMNT_0048181507 /DNA_START=122 /DNA_END=2011 /DNA_ORIENTATION=+